MVSASATFASILRCIQLRRALPSLPNIHRARSTTTSAAATSAHAMKSWQNGLLMFLPAQYCARKETHSQSLESCAISLPRSTVGPARPASLANFSQNFGGAGDLAHAAALVVAHRLDELLLGVHHERAVARDRLGDGNAREKQQPAPGRGAPKANSVALDQQRHLAVANLRALVPDEHRTLEHIHERLLLARERCCHVRRSVYRPVLVDDRDVRVDHGARPERLARDHPHARASVLALRLGNLARGNLLVARPRHLQFRRQIHPDLEAVHPPALLADAARGHLGVNDARPGGHPLHVARAEHAAVAGRVLVLELALQHISDGLEAAMRVIWRADRLAGSVIDRPHLVEQ